jgi:hypothetical protein
VALAKDVEKRKHDDERLRLSLWRCWDAFVAQYG